MEHLKLPEESLYDFPKDALDRGKECLKLYREFNRRCWQLDREISEIMDDEGNIYDAEGNVLDNHPKVIEYDELESKVIELEKGSIYVALYKALHCMKARARTIDDMREQINQLKEQLKK